MIERRLNLSAITPDNGPMMTLGRKRATIIKATERLEPVSRNAMVYTAIVSNQSPIWLTT